VPYLLSMTAAPKNRESLAPDVASTHDKILIVDFGSQVTQLIARRVREEGVYSEIVPFQKAEAAFREMKPKAVILSGGPASVLDKDAPSTPMAIFNAGVPVLGICYGEQTMAQQLAALSRPVIIVNLAALRSRSPTTARCSTASGRKAAATMSG